MWMETCVLKPLNLMALYMGAQNTLKLLGKHKATQQNGVWHLRMGNLNMTDLKRLKTLSSGMNFSVKERSSFCESCCQANMTTTAFKWGRESRPSLSKYMWAHSLAFSSSNYWRFFYSLTLIDKFLNTTWVENLYCKGAGVSGILCKHEWPHEKSCWYFSVFFLD